LSSKQATGGRASQRQAKKSRKSAGPLLRLKEKIIRSHRSRLGVHQEFLRDEVRWGRLVGDNVELEVGDDAVPDGLIGEESDDAHLSAALRTKEGVNLKNCLASAKFGRRLIFF
jgi:hypothetical protein